MECHPRSIGMAGTSSFSLLGRLQSCCKALDSTIWEASLFRSGPLAVEKHDLHRAAALSIGSPCSVIIFTKNEELHLPSCLGSLRWCDDVIVVDSYSTDDSAKICSDA